MTTASFSAPRVFSCVKFAKYHSYLNVKMYNNKKDIDKHVQSLKTKLSEKEFTTRAFSIARLYYDVGDYANSKLYVEQYLGLKNNNAAAYKLLGQTFHKLGQKEMALDQYKTSLDIDPTQTTLILDICEILADNETKIDPVQVKYWSEKAEATFPRHPITFRLRERLITKDNPNPETLLKLLQSEVTKRPKDCVLHIRLLKCYLQMNKIKEALEHSANLEFGEHPFLNSFDWYETLSEILEHKVDGIDWLYQLLLLTVKERICTLNLTEICSEASKSILQSCNVLFSYGTAIQAVSKAGVPLGFAEFHTNLIHHHRGQFAFHTATLLLKKAKKNQLSWRSATISASPLILVALHTVPVDLKAKWVALAPPKQQNAAHRWFKEGSYRCSQSGHYILSNTKEKSQSSLDQIFESCSDNQWKEKIFEKIFIFEENSVKDKTSDFFLEIVSNPVLRLPRRSEIQNYDADAQRLHPNSLHHFVWMLLNYKNYAHFKCTVFDMLTPKSYNYANCGPETLDRLDMLAFLFSATLTAQQNKPNQTVCDVSHKPDVLPANITDILCPLPQMKWWDCAYKFSQNELGTELTDIRATLSRGIEVIRCIDNHGLDAEFLCKLGHIFGECADLSTSVDEKKNFQIRACLYYNAAIPILEKIKNNIAVHLPGNRMFNYVHKDFTNKDLNSLVDTSKLYVAIAHHKDCEYEKVIEILSDVKSTKAYYYLSDAYHKLALEDNNVTGDFTTDRKSKVVTLLNKAKYFASKSLDCMQNDEPNKDTLLLSNIQELLEDIEMKLNGDVSGFVNEVDGRYSEYISLRENDISQQGKSHYARNISSTPKHTLKVNLTNYRSALDTDIQEKIENDNKRFEIIENQIKDLQKTCYEFMEQSKNWFEENPIVRMINCNIKTTTEQFQLLKISMDQVKYQVDECRNECKGVNELKQQIADLKKELNKIKKPTADHTNDNSDLYNLEEEYRTNENTSSFTTQLPFTQPQVLPPFNPRLGIPPFPMPPNAYQLYGQSLYNLYNQYSQFAQTQQIPGVPPMFDSNRPHLNYPAMYPGAEQMYLDIAHLVPPTVPSAASVPTVHPVPTAPMHTVSMPQITVPQSVPIAPVSTVSWPASGSSAKPKHTVMETKEVSRSLPVNVVITSSDPLPTCTTAPMPVLSVTIPSKHIKGTPHNYQISMPSNEVKGVLPQLDSFQKTGNVSVASSVADWNKSLVFKTSQPIGSSVTSPSTNSSNLNIKHVSSLNNPNTSADFIGTSPNTTLNKSRTLSEKSNNSIESYDPCPDFKPIVPLPAEVQITTGEEDETVLFSARAKLYRFVDKQWKERGLGDIKLLKHKVTGKVRVLMRREQIHKICANHIITPEMEIKPMLNEHKAYFWVANDFADETVTLEMLSVRFKTADIGQEFFKAFESARKASNISTPTKDTTKEAIISQMVEKDPNQTVVPQPGKTIVGGFTFSSTPTFKAVTEEKDIKEEKSEITPVNVFSGFNFKTTVPTFTNLFSQSNVTVQNKSNEADKTLNNSDTVEEFEPQVEYKPVVPLPELIEQKTGEEDEDVLFEHRAKLLRFDASSKEWKERGLGDIKILVHRDNNQKARILMRREQVMKVCCNHSITVDMIFQKKPNTDKAVTWCAKDFSEGFLAPETFCVRFKTVKACDDFIEAIKLSQSRMKDTSKAAKEEQNAAKQHIQTDFGDRFKPKSGSWHCKSCYTNNLATFPKCACCEEPRPQDDTSKDSENTPKITLNWGDKFKPKTGSWECKECLVSNDANQEKCCACNSLKDKPLPVEGIKSTAIKPVTSDVNTTDNNDSWKNLFKPKEGSWACQACYVRNENNFEECCSCGSPKDPTALKTEKASSIFGNSTSSVQFKFGIPAMKSVENMTPTKTSIFDGSGAHQFKFGMPQSIPEKSSNVIVVSFGEQKPISQTVFGIPKTSSDSSGIINFSMKNNNSDNTTVKPVKPALLPTPQSETTTVASIGGNENRKFDFVFKAKSPQKDKTPTKTTKNDNSNESDEYASEDEGHHIHFSPIVPLPDKIEVKTGEEDEDILYSHRAKVYIFVASEWKERGVGTVKLLKHKNTGKLRIVMRREQVLKMCLNHALTPEIVYTPKDEKTWLFAAYDFSDGELSLEQFCLRFPNKDVALKFKEAVDNARGEIADGIKDTKKEKNDDDVVFVEEIQASQEEKEKAKELMLPENFYTYKIKEPCTGCRGCQDSEDDVAASAKNTDEVIKQIEPVAISTPVKTSTSFSSLYATPANLKDTFNTSVFFTPNTLQDCNNSQNSTFASPFNKSVTLVDPDKTETPTKMKNPLAPSKLNANTTEMNKSLDVKPAFGDTLKQGFSFQAPVTSLFNFKSDNQADTAKESEVTSLFGGDSLQKPINYFSGTQGSSLFGPAGNNQPKSEAFPVNKPVFGNLSQETSMWNFNSSTDQKKPDVTATTNVDQKTNDVNKDSDRASDALLNVDDNLSFAALSSATSEFNIEKKVDFKWDGAGQQLFTVHQKTDETGAGEEANTSGGPDEYDPHYDPIVPLPDKIVVTTGEEDEEKVFGERSKLYRYDDKSREWKERGVGEVKILYHPQRKTYRLLLRREQVHKAVLNMLLFTDLELLPMKNTDRAWTWVGTNFAENSAGEQETLALRFKSVELANKFRDTVVQCVRKLQAAAAQAIREKENVPETTPQESIALLRLPKHLMDSPRADNAMKSKVEQQIAAAASPKLATAFSFPSTNAIAPSKSSAFDFNSSEQGNKQNGATQNQSYSQYRQVSNAGAESEDDQDTEEGDDDQDDYAEYDHNREYDLYEEDDESTAYYTCSGHAVVRETGGATQDCPEAHVQVLFDQEYSAPKILVTDANTGEILVDMLIYTDTEFQLADNMCSWAGVDYTRNDPAEKSVSVTFDDIDTALQFYDSCETSKAATTYTDAEA